MSLPATAIVSLEEFRSYAAVEGDGDDSGMEVDIVGATEMIEAFIRRAVVSRGSQTEYHTMATGGVPLLTEKLYLLDYPVIAISSIAESTAWPRDYGTALGAADYELVPSTGLVRRLGSGGPKNWAVGSRAIRVVYTNGYAKTALVPARIKSVALRLADALREERLRKDAGIQQRNDSSGTTIRFTPATLTKEMKAELHSELRHDYGSTGERAA